MPATSLRFLKTFQIAAHRGSFAAAARELCVTASAVSHQIRALELQLGVALFERAPRSLQLTAAGERLLVQIDPAFEQLEQAVTLLRQQGRRAPLRLQVPPFFAQELLLPRLGAFSAAHPQMDLQIATRSAALGTHSADVDVSVLLGAGAWPELAARRLFPLSFVPACAPALLRASGVRSHGDLAGEVLLAHARRADLWQRWAQGVGLENLRPRQLIHFDTMSAVVNAAERGIGFALVATPLAQSRFASGALAQVFAREIATGESFHAVARPADAERPTVAALLSWLVAEFGAGQSQA